MAVPVEPSSVPDDFPKRLQAYREARGLTRREFAARVGVPFATVARWEMGHIDELRHRPDMWARIAAVLEE